MKTSKEKPKPILLKKCERCANKFPSREVFTVRDRNICQLCGQIEIAEWNNYVRDADKAGAVSRSAFRRT